MSTPVGLDTQTPNIARMWDYLLGGKDNFAADRGAADRINEICDRVNAPNGRVVAAENRGFIRRAVTHLTDIGIRQFIDIGAGLPTQGNVHEIAQKINPDVRVIYVDNDPMVLAHGRVLLINDSRTRVVLGDIRRPLDILADPDVRALINPEEPVAVLLVAVLHLLADDDYPAGIVAQLRDAVAPGSYLAITHSTSDARPDLAAAVAGEFRRLGVTNPLVPRTHAEITSFFTGLELVEPGVVFPARWHPDPAAGWPAENADEVGDGAQWMYAGMGRA